MTDLLLPDDHSIVARAAEWTSRRWSHGYHGETPVDGGRLVVIGMQGGTTAELDIAALLAKRGAVHATSLRSRPAAQKAEIDAATLEGVWPAVEVGRYVRSSTGCSR